MDEDMRTLWCGNLSDRVTEEILYELFLQGGPVQRVTIPKDNNGKQRAYGFVTYKHISSVSYALSLFEGTRLYNRVINMNTRNSTGSPINLPDYFFNFDEKLYLGHEVLLSREQTQFGMNMLPRSGPYFNQVEIHSYKEDRKSNRTHPYRREENRDKNYHRDHSTSFSENFRSSDHSRRDYRSSKRRHH